MEPIEWYETYDWVGVKTGYNNPVVKASAIKVLEITTHHKGEFGLWTYIEGKSVLLGLFDSAEKATEARDALIKWVQPE